MTCLILPGDPLFQATLDWATPPDWRAVAAQHGGDLAFVVRADTGLMEPVSLPELDEYLEGGEYEMRLSRLADTSLGLEFAGAG